MTGARNHERLNAAVLAHLAVAMEAQDAFAAAADLAAGYQADIPAGTLVVGERSFKVVLLGTVSKQAGTWRWSWASRSFPADLPSIAPATGVRQWADTWGMWELAAEEFPLEGVVDTGLGVGASIAVIASTLIGAVGFYQADYGAGVAFFGIVDPGLSRPPADPRRLPMLMLRADDHVPGSGRSQLLTYARVHDLRVTGDEAHVLVHLPTGEVMAVDFDSAGRPIHFGTPVSP